MIIIPQGVTYCYISTSPARLHDEGVVIEIHSSIVDTYVLLLVPIMMAHNQMSSGAGCGAAYLPVDGS